MAISEVIRLIIELEGNQNAARSFRALRDHSRALQSDAKNITESISAMQQRVRGDMQDLQTFLAASSGSFRDSLQTGLVIPEHVARNIEEEAARIKKASEDAEKARKALGQGAADGTRAQLQYNEAQKRGNLLLIDAGRMFQDLQYGMRAAVNNFDPLILNSQRYFDAIRAANGGTLTFTNTMRGLFALMSGPSGILLIINLLFLLDGLTGVFDPITEGISNFVDGLKGASDGTKELKEATDEAISSQTDLMEGYDPSRAIANLRNITMEITNLADERKWNSIARGLYYIGSVGGSELTGQIGTQLGKQNKEIGEEIEALERLQEEYREVVAAFQAEVFIIEQGGDLAAQLRKNVLDEVAKVNLQILENQRRTGQTSIALERDIAQAQAGVVANEYEKLAQAQRNKADELIDNQYRLQSELDKARKDFAQGRTTQDAVSEAESALANMQQQIGAVQTYADTLASFAASTRNKALSDVAMLAQEIALNRTRTLEDLTHDIEEAQVSTMQEGSAKRIRQMELETEAQKRQLDRQYQDYARQYGPDGELLRTIEAYKESLDKVLQGETEEVLRDEIRMYRDHNESLIAIEDRREEIMGGSRIRNLRERLQRLQAYAVQEQDNAEKSMELARDVQQTQADIDAHEESIHQRRLARMRAQGQAERDYQQARIDVFDALAVDRALTDRDAIGVLTTQYARLTGELEMAARGAAEYESIQARIAEVESEINDEVGTQSAKLADLRAERAQLVTELERAEGAQSRYNQLQYELLSIEQEIARREQAIFERRVHTMERYTQQIINSIIEVSQASRRYTELDIEYEAFQNRQKRLQLDRSLRDQKISREEYSLEVRRLAQEEAEFERSLREDERGAVEVIVRGMTEMIIQEGGKRLAAFLAQEGVRLAFGQAAAHTAAASVSAAMLEIAATAGAAAGAVSIATFGSAAGVGSAAAISAIAAVKAATLASSVGFEKGGWTGGRGRKQAAGIVHGQEFVFSADAVRGNPTPFYALMKALRRGLDPNSILMWLSQAGYSATPSGVRHATGFGYELGGYVDAARSLMPGGPSSIEVMNMIDITPIVEQNARLTREVASLRNTVREFTSNPFQLVIGRRTGSQMIQGSGQYRRATVVSNPYIKRNSAQ